MNYDFDEIISRRNTNAMNTDGFREYIFHVGPEAQFAYKDEEFVRMWVADMEFAVAPEICEAIKERVDKRIFGYTQLKDPQYFQAVAAWYEKFYDWGFKPEELVFSPGIIPALYELTVDILKPGEKLLINTPAYGFFKHAAVYAGRELVMSPLKNDQGNFTIDFEDFEKKAADPMVKLVLFCNPHNPSGRVWTESELSEVARIIRQYDLWVISDEIHCDLLRQGQKHIPLGKVMPDYDKLITCMAASKTFNLAGLMFSHIIIRNAELRETFKKHDKTIGFLNPLSVAANQAAYEKGGEWLDQMKTYLDDNFRFTADFLAEHLPGAVFKIPEATYLAWVDLRQCLPGVDDLPLFFANQAGVLLEGGDELFVQNAKGFIRLNLAMPRKIVQEGLSRIVKAINSQDSR